MSSALPAANSATDPVGPETEPPLPPPFIFVFACMSMRACLAFFCAILSCVCAPSKLFFCRSSSAFIFSMSARIASFSALVFAISFLRVRGIFEVIWG
jgi:hypothetical protein